MGLAKFVLGGIVMLAGFMLAKGNSLSFDKGALGIGLMLGGLVIMFIL